MSLPDHHWPAIICAILGAEKHGLTCRINAVITWRNCFPSFVQRGQDAWRSEGEC